LSLAWLSDASIPLLLTSSDLSVAWLNASAREELARRQGIEIRDGVLTTTSPSLHERLLDLTTPGQGTQVTVCIRASESEAHVVVHSRRLDAADAEPRFGIWFHRAGQDFKPVYAGLDRAFGFTTAEQRVMARLLDGDSIPQIARALKLSVETIRSHVRNIYAKMDVSSRAEMFSLVRAFRI
jgi:DNA-binding CsgD family transcriptional regulator